MRSETCALELYIQCMVTSQAGILYRIMKLIGLHLPSVMCIIWTIFNLLDLTSKFQWHIAIYYRPIYLPIVFNGLGVGFIDLFCFILFWYFFLFVCLFFVFVFHFLFFIFPPFLGGGGVCFVLLFVCLVKLLLVCFGVIVVVVGGGILFCLFVCFGFVFSIVLYFDIHSTSLSQVILIT